MTPFSAFLARWPLGVWHHRSGGLLRMVPLARLHMSPSGPLQLERFRLYPVIKKGHVVMFAINSR